jgi:hypothetical protein
MVVGTTQNGVVTHGPGKAKPTSQQPPRNPLWRKHLAENADVLPKVASWVVQKGIQPSGKIKARPKEKIREMTLRALREESAYWQRAEVESVLAPRTVKIAKRWDRSRGRNWYLRTRAEAAETAADRRQGQRTRGDAGSDRKSAGRVERRVIHILKSRG